MENSTKHLKELSLIVHNHFQKNRNEGSPTPLMSIDEKFLSKVLASRIQQCIERIIHYDQVEFTSRMQRCFSIQNSINVICQINKLEKKNHIILQSYTEKATDKIQYLLM